MGVCNEKSNRIEELESLYHEYVAYREMQYETFNFGHGEVKNESESESVYLKMQIVSIEEAIFDEINFPKQSYKSKKQRPNKYYTNKKYKARLQKMADAGYAWYAFYNVEVRGTGKTYPTRIYRRSSSPYLKKVSNKKVRLYKGELEPKSMKFHRIYDFKWNYW